MKEDIVKKQITRDWQTAFPGLTTFAQNKFYRIFGPLVAGIELVNLPRVSGYRPHIVIYPLWGNKMGNDVKACLASPAIMFHILNRKGLQFDIWNEEHTIYLQEAIECTQQQLLLPLESDVTLDALFALVNDRFKDVLINSHSAQQVKLYEFKLNAALYTGSDVRLNEVLNEIKTEEKNWNRQQFEPAFGKFEQWFEGLRHRIDNRNEFIELIGVNKHDKKLMKLTVSELIE